MQLTRREFVQALGAAALLGGGPGVKAAQAADMYDLKPAGNVSLLHLTDCHAQLLPMYFREPAGSIDTTGYLQLVKRPDHGPMAYACTANQFEERAHLYGKMGGFAHLATLIKRLRADRPNSLLLDGGDLWQGSATSLFTRGEDMARASVLLGVDIMTLHWECTYGSDRVLELAKTTLKDKVQVLAQNIRTADFEDPVFASHSVREINGVKVAIIGQAFPYTPIAHPRELVQDWTFGIREAELQALVTKLRGQGAQVCVLLSHNGFQVDMKMASRVEGIDFILGGHTHDAVPEALPVKNNGGTTWVTNAGCSGKFVGLLDMDIREGRLQGFKYRLVPVFSNLLPADSAMQQFIDEVRKPHLAELNQPLAVVTEMLYRRGNFNGTWDQLILDALMSHHDAEAAFSPGFRWGTTLLPGDTISMEDVYNVTAITYGQTTLTDIKGYMIKTILEDVADNLFNPDPYYQQGGDMVRVAGLTYNVRPYERIGKRIDDLRYKGQPLGADQVLKVAGWASVREGALQSKAPPVWAVVKDYLTRA